MRECKNCAWWEKMGDETNDLDDNICRCHSPRPLVIDISDNKGESAWNSSDYDWIPGFTIWPVTRKDDWCGEFKPKVKTKKGQ